MATETTVDEAEHRQTCTFANATGGIHGLTVVVHRYVGSTNGICGATQRTTCVFRLSMDLVFRFLARNLDK